MLSCLHRRNISTMFWVLAEHLAPEPIQPDGQYVCSDNVATQSRLAPAPVAIQIAGQRESELRCCCKKLNFWLFCVGEFVCAYVCTCAVGGRYMLVRFEPTAQKMVKLFKGTEGWGNCAVSALHDEHRWFLFSLDNFLRIQGPNTSWKRRRASKMQQSFCLNNNCWVAGTAGAYVSNLLLDLLMSAKFSLCFTEMPVCLSTRSKHKRPPDQSTQWKCKFCITTGSGMPYLHTYPSFLWQKTLRPARPFRLRRLSNSQLFNHHQHGSLPQ